MLVDVETTTSGCKILFFFLLTKIENNHVSIRIAFASNIYICNISFIIVNVLLMPDLFTYIVLRKMFHWISTYFFVYLYIFFLLFIVLKTIIVFNDHFSHSF